ncbi:cardiolipin synthase [Humisphaera borealis]|uniref:Cardiolipin synthase n=1 Tax=Humisphaera borealis TaxID=2807512 RepID=A0A7M2X5J1_9BACT|nr:cardiolipin synthase [Humisphaera borealis]
MTHLATLYLISEWTIRLIMLLHVPQKRTPAAARTWLLIIFLLPWPGLIVYMLIGRPYLPEKRRRARELASRQIIEIQKRIGRHHVATPELPANLAQASSLAAHLGDFEPFSGNEVELLDDYEGAIDRLIADIDAAVHHAHLLFYIVAPDCTGRRVCDALIRAAKRGVNARLLVDGVGSKGFLKRMAAEVRSSGVEVITLLPTGFFRQNAARFDLRNHRKIAVIDGQIGYTGSQNIVDPEFVPGRPNEELMMRITGPLVMQLQAVFLADRFAETADSILTPDLLPPPMLQAPAEGKPTGVTAQLLPSGPGYQHENGQELIVALLHGAKERVVIATPYFIPDEPLLQAMQSAVLRGVDVRLVVSEKSNQLITEFAQQSFYDELLAAKIKVYRYRPRFLHAKHLSIDDRICVIGTSNMDIRSFKLNAEVVAIFYDIDVTRRLRVIQERYFAGSVILAADEWARRPAWRRLIQNIARMADALL